MKDEQRPHARSQAAGSAAANREAAANTDTAPIPEQTREAADALCARIRERTARVAIVGLGYVGLPLAHAFHRSGFPVIGVDVDPQKIRSIAAGRSYFNHFDSEKVQELGESDRFSGTTDFADIAEADAILMCVPTPLDTHREPDLSYVTATAESIAPYLRRGQIVVLESTTYPGTTDELLRDTLREAASRAGNDLTPDVDFFLAYSPEREDPGNIDFETSRIPKVVGADTEPARSAAEALYNGVVSQVVPVSSSRTAEAVKLLENIFRSVNIALVNELKLVFEKMNIDIHEVVDAAKTKPFGFMPFYPGPGLGGHCIPIDPFYLTWKAKEFGLHSQFIELSGQVNTGMPAYVVNRTAEALNDASKSVRGSRILVLGLAYKPEVGDTRESPSFEIIDLLAARGAHVDYHDPYVAEIPHTRHWPHLAGRRSVAFDKKTVSAYDAVVIVTDHKTIDYNDLASWACCIVDSRGAMRHVPHGDTPVWVA